MAAANTDMSSYAYDYFENEMQRCFGFEGWWIEARVMRVGGDNHHDPV